MKPQAFQLGELRDEHDQIIRAGSYGKKTPFVSADNNAILDYIMNNFDALYAQIPNGRAYVKSVNNITPDSNGNVTINLGSGGGTGGTNITVDSTLSSTSTNPVQNKVIYAALNNKLDKNGVATYAACDSSGNIISSTYARKTELSGYVKSINNVKPDGAGNVNISTGGGGSNLTVDATLDGTSSNAIANKAVYAALNNKLDKNGTAMYASRDSSGNVFGTTYATKTELSKCVKSINNLTPDSSGNVNISTSGGGTNITVDTALSGTSNNAISNKAVYEALSGKLDKTGTATAAIKATQDGEGNVIATTYIKTINNLKPDSDGNVNISGGTGGNITVDSVLSPTSTNAIQNRVVQQEFTSVRATIPTKVSQLTNDSGYLTQHQSLDGYVKSVNNTKPDNNGNVTIALSGGGGVSTSESNTWTGKQTFQKMKFNFESYNAPRISGATDNPSESVAVYNVQGNFTLDMSELAGLLSNGDATVFTAYITANGSYTLSITNAGTLKYAGSATDLAITANGLLLNIILIKSSNGVLSSVAQASTLS